MPVFEIELEDGRILDVDAPTEALALEDVDTFLSQEASQVDPTTLSSSEKEAALKTSLQRIEDETPEQLGVAKGVGEAMFQTGTAVVEGLARTVENLGQLSMDGAELVGLVPTGTGDAVAKHSAIESSKRSRAASDAAASIFNDDGVAEQVEESFDRNADLAEVAVMLGVNPATAGKTFLGSLFKGVTTGTVMGGVAPTRDAKAEDRWRKRTENASMGALFGFGAQVAPATLGAIWRGVTRPISNALNRGAAKVQDLAQDRGIFISLGEAGDSGRTLGFEANVVNDIKNDRMRDSVKALLTDTEGIIQNISRAAGREYRATFSRAQNTAKKTVEHMNREKSALWSDGMREVDRLVEKAGGQVKTVPNILRAQIDELFEDVATAGLTDAKFGNRLIQWRTEVDAAVKAGGATPKDVGRWLKQIESASRGFGNIFDNADDVGLQRIFMNKVRTSLLQDIGENTVGDPAALRKMVGVRDDYRQVSDNIRKLEAETATAFLGNPKNAREALAKLKQLEPGQQRELVDFLRESADGEAVRREMVGQVLRDAVQKSSRSDAGSIFAGWDLGKFRKELIAPTTPSETKRTLISGLMNKKEEARVMENLGLAQKLLNGQASSIGAGKLPVNIEDAAINVISQDPGFIARYAARIFSNSDSFSKMLFEPEANKHLRNLVTKGDKLGLRGNNKTPVRNALIWFNALAGQNEAEQQGEE